MVDFERPSSLTSPEQKARWQVISKFRPLITTVRVLTNKHLAPLFRTMLDEFDEALFNLSDDAKTNAKQTEYFDLMRTVRHRRENIEQIFFEKVHQCSEDFIQGTLFDDKSTHNDKLALVGKDHLELSLAGKQVVEKSLERYRIDVSKLNHRFAVISGGIKPGEDSPLLPSGPAHIVSAFEYAIEPVALPSEALLVAFKLFDEYVMGQMAPLYQRINDQMVRANILPNLKVEAYTAPEKQPEGEDAAETVPDLDQDQQEQETQGELQAPPPVEKIALTRDEREMFISISTMLMDKRERSGFQEDASQIKATSDELISALTQIQTQEQTITSIQAELESMETFKNTLLEQVQTSSAAEGLSSADADIIDMVGMMFEYVLDDPMLTDTVKTLLSRLHTPYLKVALLDSYFFVQQTHPARHLLNLMAKTANKNQLTARDEYGIFAKLESVVDRIITNFQDDAGIFHQLLEDFKGFTQNFEEKKKQLEQRAVVAAKSQESLKLARTKTTNILKEKLKDRYLPEAMLKIITGPWANLLVLTLLPKSKVSGRWDVCILVVDELIILHSKPPDNWQRALESVLGKLKKGLMVIGYPQAESETLLEALEKWQPLAIPNTQTAHQGEIEWSGGLEEKKSSLPLSKAERLTLDRLIKKLTTLPFGTWFDFNTDKDEKYQQRVKLAWFSTGTSNYMFVNSSGAKVGMKSLDQLVQEIREARTSIVEEVVQKPLVDRALSFMMNRLKSS